MTPALTNGSETGGYSACVSPTPTPTVTSTVTVTPTVTTTPTVTPTQTIGYFTYSLGFSGTSAADACTNFASPNTYYAPLAGGPGPNIGETLYTDSALTTPASNGYYSNGVAWYQITGGAGLVTSPTVATILESILGFASTSNGEADQMEYAFGVQKIGTVNGRYKVYKNPYLTENLILMQEQERE